MKKHLGLIIAVIIVAAGAFYLFNNNQAKAPVQQENEPVSNNQEQIPAENKNTDTATSTSPDKKGGTYSSGDDQAPNSDIQVVEIVYDGTKFTPSTVTIKKNDYVFFKNSSNTEFWPASNPHPVHSDYSVFDPKKPIEAGGVFKFQFTEVGTWGFHDHLNPKAKGTVTVSQ